MRQAGHHGLHATVTLPLPNGGGSVPVDAALARLMQALWAAGLRTKECCQDDEMLEGASVRFGSAPDAVKFVRCVVAYLNEYDHVEDVYDVGVDARDFPIFLSDFDTSATVTFPTRAIGVVTDAWTAEALP